MNKTGFGFLRLPRFDPDDEKSINYALLNEMVDYFLAQGGDYFDTAYTYLGGESENALKKSVVERYPRDSFRIADKLPSFEVSAAEDCLRFFEESLSRCGVDFFDVYLLHGLNEENYELAVKHEMFPFLQQMKQEGKVKKTGFSYHDGPQLLDKILTEHPEIDYVQLQINYLDWESVSIQAKKCYETAIRHGKKVIVMEPVKGGSLANLPEKAAEILRKVHPKDSPASWAIRFATDLPEVEVVLSGMNTMEQLTDNMRDMHPLKDSELGALAKAAEIICANTAVACAGCSYCTSDCPVKMPIPQYFALYNDYARYPNENWKMEHAYNSLANSFAKASDCIGCKQCEKRCPQKLNITKHLTAVAEVFENIE